MNTTGFREIPIVDFARASTVAERPELVAELRGICHEIGFFVLVNHDVEQHFIDRIFAMQEKLFALPDEVKRSVDKIHSRHFRGWESVGTEFTNNQPDIREQVDLWSDRDARADDVEPAYLRLYGPNQYFSDAVLEGFRSLMDEWFARMGALADELMGLLAEGLGLDTDHFSRLFGEETMSLTKLIRYPATPPGQAGVNPHHDAGFLTILVPGATPGLQVESPDGAWVDVPRIPGGFVINLGEMLQAMTGNYFVATPHRVITEAERYSAGYFHGPALDTPLTGLPLDARFAEAVASSPRHAQAGFMAQAAETDAGVAAMASLEHPDLYGEQIWNYFVRSYPRIVAAHYPELVAPPG